MNPSAVIREARNVLFERGWYQGDAVGPDGSLCLYGAISVVPHGSVCRLRPLLCEAIGVDAALAGLPSVWNDAPTTTFSDVIDMLDRAEKIAEQREVLDA